MSSKSKHYIQNELGALKTGTVFTIFLALFCVGIIWYTLSTNNQNMPLPIIRADTSPVRIDPKEQGGIKIPNADSTLYKSIRPQSAQKRVENLLADPQPATSAPPRINTGKLNVAGASEAKESIIAEGAEPPISAPIKAPVTTKPITSESSEGATATTASNEQQQPQTNAKPKRSVTTAPIARPKTIKTKSDEAPVTKNPATKNPATKNKDFTSVLAEAQGLKTAPISKQNPTTRATTKIAPKGDYYVQIGSLRSDDSARKHWQSRKKEFSELSSLKLRIQTATIEGRGTFHRVQAGPTSKDHASQACSAINAKYAKSCIVKK